MATGVLGDFFKCVICIKSYNKYMNKVPIVSYFLCKIPIFFLFYGIPYFF